MVITMIRAGYTNISWFALLSEAFFFLPENLMGFFSLFFSFKKNVNLYLMLQNKIHPDTSEKAVSWVVKQVLSAILQTLS